MRNAVKALVFALILLSATGCSRQPIDIETLEGSWVYEDDRGHSSELTISGDGSFAIDVAPWQVFDYLNESADSLESIDWVRSSPAEGTIDITETVIWLSFEGGHLDGRNNQISLNWPRQDRLSVGIGDPDYGIFFTYTREETP